MLAPARRPGNRTVLWSTVVAVFCTNCGHRNPEGVNFCSSCGNPLLLDGDDATITLHPADENAREDFLAVFAPLNLVLNLMTWSLLMLIGYAAIFYALSDQVRPHLASFGEAFYFAGASFFTIGFGDFVGNTGLPRLASLAAGASGFGIISTTTAYLFAIFGAFQAREQFVVVVGARAGSPPSTALAKVVCRTP